MESSAGCSSSRVLKDASNQIAEESSNNNSEKVDKLSLDVLLNYQLDDAKVINLNSKEMQMQLRKNLGHIKTKFEGKMADFKVGTEKEKKPIRLVKVVEYKAKDIEGIELNEGEEASKSIWLQKSPFFIANVRQSQQQNPVTRDLFPKRDRSRFCYICGDGTGKLIKCSFAGCPTRFHDLCLKNNSAGGGYSAKFMKRKHGIYCSRHHCTACFADHNRSRCFNGALVPCDQCELAWHMNCIPGGCEPNAANEITCPRHVAFPDSPNLHLVYCAYCQQRPTSDSSLLKCSKCFRAAHKECYNESKLVPTPEDNDSPNDSITCQWCEMFDFVRYGEFAMARFARLKWYPCEVVSNSEYPNQKHHLLGSVGYLCVKWLPYRGKTYYNLISHNRIIAMSDRDYFFVTEAHKSSCYAEWKVAQRYMVKNSALNSLPALDQIPDVGISNGEKMVKQIVRNRYTSNDLRNLRRIYPAELCKCPINQKGRCGPSSNCINRTLFLECPKGCGDEGKMGCGNRLISEAKDECVWVPIKIKYYPGKGYGAEAAKNIPCGAFIGEYVGEVISAQEKELRIQRLASLQSNETQYYIMELDERRAVDAQYYGSDMRYVNHSCNPNAVIQQVQSDFDIHIVLIADRDIKKGEELSFDYNMKGGRSVPVCHCGEPNCTGVLSADENAKRTLSVDTEQSPSTSDIGHLRRASTIPKKKSDAGNSCTLSAPVPTRRRQQPTADEGNSGSAEKDGKINGEPPAKRSRKGSHD